MLIQILEQLHQRRTGHCTRLVLQQLIDHGHHHLERDRRRLWEHRAEEEHDDESGVVAEGAANEHPNAALDDVGPAFLADVAADAARDCVGDGEGLGAPGVEVQLSLAQVEDVHRVAVEGVGRQTREGMIFLKIDSQL